MVLNLAQARFAWSIVRRFLTRQGTLPYNVFREFDPYECDEAALAALAALVP